jgi:leucyl-tRNA synthetase
MSKTKNTPEFQRMMDELESATMFNYAEQEQEKEQLLQDLAVHQAIEQATDEYIQAQKVFLEAQRKFTVALNEYKNYRGGLTSNEQRLDDAVAQLTDLFKGFNPADV